ncbi:MAG: cohesin domain-containing protein, partial [Bacteroidota bacterium]
DNCPGDIIISFSADTSDQCRIFLCNQTYLDLPIEIWATDAAGNQAHCETTIYIQDNMFSCDSNVPIYGKISNWKQQAVAGVKVQLNGSMGNLDFVTQADGDYSFEDLEEGDYTIAPHKNTEPLNGVTTFDLVLISRHILNIDKLASPFQIIAADANHSGAVTTFDLVALRKLVLFIEDELPGNTSWRFVPKSFQFPNPSDPWQTPFPEVLSFNNLDEEVSDAHFIAIKIGDINGNANPNFGGDNANEDRGSQSPLILEANEQSFQAGETVQATFRAKDFKQVAGFQFTLDFDPKQLEFQRIVSTGEGAGGLLGEENFGLKKAGEGKLTASWYEPHPVSLEDETTLFTVEFLAKTSGKLASALQVNSSLTTAEAYLGEGLEIRDVELTIQPFN